MYKDLSPLNKFLNFLTFQDPGEEIVNISRNNFSLRYLQ